MRLLAGTVLAVLLAVQMAWAADITLAVASAKAGLDAVTGQPIVQIVLTPEAAKAFARLTTDNVGKVVELRVDGALLTSPVVQTPILGGELVISGNLSEGDARALAARLLQAGAAISLTTIEH